MTIGSLAAGRTRTARATPWRHVRCQVLGTSCSLRPHHETPVSQITMTDAKEVKSAPQHLPIVMKHLATQRSREAVGCVKGALQSTWREIDRDRWPDAQTASDRTQGRRRLQDT